MEKPISRIKYVKKDNMLTSKSEIIAKNGAKYIVVINLENKTYLIRNVVSMRKFEGGEGVNNLNVLKRNVKKHLSHLGVCFESESRNRTFGLCQKSWNQQKEIEKRKQSSSIQ